MVVWGWDSELLSRRFSEKRSVETIQKYLKYFYKKSIVLEINQVSRNRIYKILLKSPRHGQNNQVPGNILRIGTRGLEHL